MIRSRVGALLRGLAMALGVAGVISAVGVWLLARGMDTSVTDSNQKLAEGWAAMIALASAVVIGVAVLGPRLVRAVRDELRPVARVDDRPRESAAPTVATEARPSNPTP